MKEKKYICSFCGKVVENVNKMVVSNENGKFVAICDECVDLSYHILNDGLEDSEINFDFKPSDVKAYLDKYVISQESAKIKAAVSVYNHFKRLKYNMKLKENEDILDNVHNICIGVTGSGKTLIWKTIAKMLNVPFVIWDTSNLSKTGYVGADVTDILAMAYKEAEEDLELAEKSIIILDEADKMARKSGRSVAAYNDIGGESVQHSLLKILEGSKIEVPLAGKRSSNTETILMDTSQMLFVLNGSFEGIEDIVKARVNKKRIGFGGEEKKYTIDDYYNMITTEDLIDYGMLPEILGRAPSIIILNSLKEEDLIKILIEPKNAIVKQYEKMFKMDKVHLSFKDDSLKKIAQFALKKKTNARGLKSIVDQLLSPLMYKIPDNNKIDSIVISNNLKDLKLR